MSWREAGRERHGRIRFCGAMVACFGRHDQSSPTAAPQAKTAASNAQDHPVSRSYSSVFDAWNPAQYRADAGSTPCG